MAASKWPAVRSMSDGELDRENENHLRGYYKATAANRTRAGVVQREIARRAARKQKAAAPKPAKAPAKPRAARTKKAAANAVPAPTPAPARERKPARPATDKPHKLSRLHVAKSRIGAYATLRTDVGMEQADAPVFAGGYDIKSDARRLARRYPGVIGAHSEVLRLVEKLHDVRDRLRSARIARDHAGSSALRKSFEQSVSKLTADEKQLVHAVDAAEATFNSKFQAAYKIEYTKLKKLQPPAKKKAESFAARRKRKIKESAAADTTLADLLAAQRAYRDTPNAVNLLRVRRAQAAYRERHPSTVTPLSPAELHARRVAAARAELERKSTNFGRGYETAKKKSKRAPKKEYEKTERLPNGRAYTVPTTKQPRERHRRQARQEAARKTK